MWSSFRKYFTWFNIMYAVFSFSCSYIKKYFQHMSTSAPANCARSEPLILHIKLSMCPYAYTLPETIYLYSAVYSTSISGTVSYIAGYTFNAAERGICLCWHISGSGAPRFSSSGRHRLCIIGLHTPRAPPSCAVAQCAPLICPPEHAFETRPSSSSCTVISSFQIYLLCLYQLARCHVIRFFFLRHCNHPSSPSHPLPCLWKSYCSNLCHS
jgi:hypothetical protein